MHGRSNLLRFEVIDPQTCEIKMGVDVPSGYDDVEGIAWIKTALNSTVPASVTFSPQSELKGYLSELISVIDSTYKQLEIALYGFESGDVYDALKRASERGVEIRLLLEGAKEDRKDRKESENTLSHLLEENGIDVRYVNKTMHHKFLIAEQRFLVTSSGNWNIYANSVYDENTLWITDEELVTRYQAEFEKLWQNSREFGKTFAFSQKGADPAVY